MIKRDKGSGCLIAPLSISVVDWKIFSKSCKKNGLNDPVYLLQSKFRDIKDRESFLYSLDLDKDLNKSFNNLENYKHIFLSFIGTVDKHILGELSLCSNLAIKKYTVNDKYQFILSGTLDCWVESIINCTKENKDRSLREIFNTVDNYFNIIGFKFRFNRRELKDGTSEISYR